MNLSTIHITQLFNRYDYTLDFTNNRGISIITGPNGYGKSTILRMVNHLYSGNIYSFFELSFKSFKVTFQNSDKTKTELTIEKRILENADASQSDIIFDEHVVLDISLKDHFQNKAITFSRTSIESAIVAAGFRKEESDVWWNRDNTGYLTSSEILKIHKEIVQKQFNGATEILMFLGGLTAIMISDQRLFYLEPDSSLSVKSSLHFNKSQVLKDAQWMKEDLVVLRQSFTEMVSTAMMSAISSPPLENSHSDDLAERIKTLNKKFDTLIQYGIADEHQRIPATLSTHTAGILINMINNYEKVVNETLEKVDNHTQFVNLIQKSDFPDKSIRLDTMNGYSFISTDGTFIAPEWLSSGEQHKLILWFQMLFRAQPGMLVLIDEPELSFHVVWQTAFIKEMRQIINHRDIQVIAATHSPQIIDGKWSITTDLYDLSKRS